MAMKHLSENEIQEYLDNSDSAGRQKIITHLDGCQLCQNRVKEYESLFFHLKKAEPDELSADFTAKVMSKIETEAPAHEPRSAWAMVLSIAGVILGLVSIGYFVNLKPLFETVHLSGIQQYFDTVLFSKLIAIAGALNMELSTIIYAGLTLIIIAAIDVIIRHNRRRPISFLI
jgi:hypothetical protein